MGQYARNLSLTLCNSNYTTLAIVARKWRTTTQFTQRNTKYNIILTRVYSFSLFLLVVFIHRYVKKYHRLLSPFNLFSSIYFLANLATFVHYSKCFCNFFALLYMYAIWTSFFPLQSSMLFLVFTHISMDKNTNRMRKSGLSHSLDDAMFYYTVGGEEYVM